MKAYTLERTQTIRAAIGDCWDFFSNPANLSKITPASFGFRVLSELPPVIYEGLMLRYCVRPLMGIPLTWVTEITRVRGPGYFADEQRTGPYAMWRHEHFFRELEAGRVEIRDVVHYALPFGPLGRAVHALTVKHKINYIFDYREKAVSGLFPG